MTARAQQIGLEVATAVTAAAFGWSAACSWKGMVAEPSQYLGPALVAAVLIAVVGATGRSLRLRWYAVLGLQLVTVLVWFHHRQNSHDLGFGWIPTPHGIADVIHQVRDGADAINTYAAPVPTSYFDAPVYLAACAVLILLLIDLIACGLRLPAWAGLPVLVAVTIPISVLDGGLPSLVYVTTGLLFALLLAVVEADRASSWGPVVGQPGAPRPARPRLPVVALAAPAVLIASAATALALVASLGVPVGDGLLDPDSGSGTGDEGSGRINLTNPLVDLRRDLVRNNHLPLVDVQTDSRDLSYLRLTILDTFKDGAWTPSPRDLDSNRQASGVLPEPAGLSAANAGTESSWQLQTTRNFTTTWLPTPSVTRLITINRGDWRYDPSFLDIASADDPPPTGVDYFLKASTPVVDADVLARAQRPTGSLVASMTALPPIPAVVKEIAEEVTAGATTEHAKAALLQTWFRSTGKFTYSLDPAPGQGLDQLARFLTVDRVGYCEQFAAAMAIMARSLGIPARVVVGFLGPSETIPGGYQYTSDDLHAWPEIYFPGNGWVRFEPTPSTRTGAAPSWTRNNVEAPAPSASPRTPSSSPTQQRSQAPKPETQKPAVTTESSDGSVPTAVLAVGGAALLVLLLLLPGLVRSGQRRRRLRPGRDGLVELEALWQELRATAVDVGAPWPDDRSPRMVGERVVAWLEAAPDVTLSAEDRDALRLLVSHVERTRYRAGHLLSEAERAEAVTATHRWVDLIRTAAPQSQAWRARLAPRSLLMDRRAGRTGTAQDADELTSTSSR